MGLPPLLSSAIIASAPTALISINAHLRAGTGKGNRKSMQQQNWKGTRKRSSRNGDATGERETSRKKDETAHDKNTEGIVTGNKERKKGETSGLTSGFLR
jgi:hypothetical protein